MKRIFISGSFGRCVVLPRGWEDSPGAGYGMFAWATCDSFEFAALFNGERR